MNVKPAPGVWESVKMFFSRYADFKGCSRRAEYWKVALFQVLVYILLCMVVGTSCVKALMIAGPGVDLMAACSGMGSCL